MIEKVGEEGSFARDTIRLKLAYCTLEPVSTVKRWKRAQGHHGCEGCGGDCIGNK